MALGVILGLYIPYIEILMKKRDVKTYIQNPYDLKKDNMQKKTTLTKDGRVWKNDLLKFDMTSQRGYK
jgi:hypothetical protein